MYLNDRQILELCRDHGMIEPYVEEQVRYVDRFDRSFVPEENTGPGDTSVERVVSYGPSSFGYDLRVGGEFKIFSPVHQVQVDPKAFDDRSFVDVTVGPGEYIVIPPNSFALARSVEYIRMPRDVTAICLGKSTYARCGIICNFTPFEAGWEGIVTIEISNSTPLPARIYAYEGIAQVLFSRGEAPLVSYADRGGKYQGQVGITTPRM